MTDAARSFDIRGLPELESLAEEVRVTSEPRILCRDGDPVAKIVPLRSRSRGYKKRNKTQADYEAFLASAGGWADVDIDAFLAANRGSRDRSTKPAIEL